MRYLKVLYVQVIIGIIAGIIVGYCFPGFAPTAKLISETFINMIKMVIAPLIFLTIVGGIAGAGELKKAGRIGGKAILYFEIVTTLALVIGLVVANLMQPGAGLDRSHLPVADISNYTAQAHELHIGEFISHIVPANIIGAFAQGDILQVLFFSVLFGVGLKWTGDAGKSLVSTFEKINKVLFNVLKIIMRLSPVGAFGGMAFTIGKYGFGTLALLGKLMACFYITGILFVFVVINAIARYYKFSLLKLLGYLKEELLIILGSSSSEAALPSLIKKLEDAGCEKEVVGLVVPTGYSFNLDGTSIYLSMCVIFLTQVFNIELTLVQQLTIIGILLLTSKGAAGVTGSGFIVLTSTLTAVKIIPVEGLALLVGVDRFMSEARALVNFIGNSVATVVIAKSENAIDMAVYSRVVEGKVPEASIIKKDEAIV